MNSFFNGAGMYLTTLLYFCIFVTSIGLVASSYDCRVMYSMLQNLESEGWSLQENHSRLLLEHSTWAAYERVEEIAKQKLFMKSPSLGSLILVSK